MIPGKCLTPLKRAIQSYDDQMRQLEKANPETFSVERRSHWAMSLTSYLDRRKIDDMFGLYKGAPLRMGTRGVLSITYKSHGDPAKVNDQLVWGVA